MPSTALEHMIRAQELLAPVIGESRAVGITNKARYAVRLGLLRARCGEWFDETVPLDDEQYAALVAVEMARLLREHGVIEEPTDG